jgi:amino acid adenylation domain-containing protein
MQQEVLEGFQLSPQQKRVWTLRQHSAAYVAQCAVLLDGALDARALREALRGVFERHEILRTAFHRLPGIKIPVQVVSECAVPPLRYFDLSGAGAGRDGPAELLRAERRLPFDCAQGPLLRLALVGLAAGRHALLVTTPSLCADARTLQLLVEDLGASYAAALRGEEPPDESISYVQVAEWQNGLLADEGEPGRDFWLKQEPAASAARPLPYQKKPAAVSEFSPESFAVEVDTGVAAGLESLARGLGVSISSCLLACWQTFLWRLTGEPEIIVGLVSDDRKYEELRSALGPFARTLPVPAKFERGIRLGEVLTATEAAAGEAVGWGEYFDWDDAADESGEPVHLHALFEYQEWLPSRPVTGMTFSLEGLYACLDRFRLKLSCARAERALVAEIHYDPAYFHAGDVERLAAQFSTLLASASRGAESRVEELEVISDAERERLLTEFSRTAEARPSPVCFHELFERQTELTPEAVALQFEERELTYAELNAAANRLAHHLRGRGVGPESLAAIYLERSAEMIVALLGVLKAGGAYMPLDAGYPKERVAALLAQAGTPLVLTTRSLKTNLSETGAEAVCLDADALAAESELNPRNLSSPENLVYVLFTSGSTGTPKGVAVEHRQLVNYLEGVRERLGLPEGASYATVSTLAADLGNTVIFSSLAAGGRLHVISQERVTDADAMEEYLGRHAVDCLKIVPSHLAALLSGRRPERLMPRARLVLGGEASRREWVEGLRALSPDCAILNHYGPTETTVGVTTFAVRDGDESATETLPVGRPLAGSRIYLLDAARRLVPSGMPGELCVGGAGVARGYLGLPGATAEKFIPDPYSEEPGARLYRTGDLARFLHDGNIEFIGRIDHQVKVRGFRIELGEIEATLRTHESVRECVVTAREDAPGAKHLVAYVVGSRDAAPNSAKLREYVRGKLPEYMVPSSVVVLDSLPLNRNGKIDRKALPAPSVSHSSASALREEPSDWYEQVLAGLWEEVLKVEGVGRDSNFFELGGHSLLATQLVSRVREAFGAELPLRALFESPTVAGLARRVAEARGAGSASAPAIVAVGGGGGGGRAVSFAQQRLWFLHQLEPGNPFYNSRHVVKLTGRLDVDALARALNEVVRRHESLRTTFNDVGGTPLQFVAPYQPCALPLSDLSALDEAGREAAVRRLDEEEAARPFDLARGPLFRASLLKLSDEEHVAMFTTHHIISDFWSMGVLVKEVAALYAAFNSGEPSPLAELPVQYADFAAWQREWLQGEVLEKELDYWRGQLSGAPPALELPTDKVRPTAPSFRSSTRRFKLSAEESAAVKALGRREGATVFMTLLAAFKALLYFHTGQDDISVGTPVAGRNRAEVENLIGCFLNTLVLRTRLSGDPTFRELLRRVRDTTLDAYTHQDVPFEKLVQEIQTSRDLSRTPLFQALIIFHNETRTTAELPELQFTGLPVERKWSNFDITLSVTEGDDGLLLALEYNSDLFEDDTMGRIAERFRALVESAVADPGKRLSDLPSLSEADRLLLASRNDTGREYPEEAAFQQLFEEQAARTPDAVAVGCDGVAVTYEELNRRANRVARLLAAEGVGPETLVGLLAGRGIDLVTSVLAVFKAGGAYLPLDPHAPAARLRQVLAQSATPLVLVSRDESQFLEATLDATPEGRRPRVLVVEELLAPRPVETDPSAAEENLPACNGPTSLAYVIYTSGSTGTPKGAMVEQRGMVNHLYAKIHDLSLGASDVVAQTASQCFDISVWQMLAALVVGGRVEVLRDAVAHDARRLPAESERAGVTILETVPSLLRAMLEEAESSGGLTSLRWMIPTGEALPPELCRRWLAAYPHVPLVNAYGPTECSDDVSHHVVREQPSATVSNIPVGRPIRNMRLYVVNKQMRLAPMGAAGELCVGGVGVGRGYLAEPSRTAGVFVPDAFSGLPGARLYRTGDLARWRADGTVEFLGRIDHQVKVRGFRIELGEIEAALAECNGVKESVVVVREDAPGDKRLVAYVVVEPWASPSVKELHARLKERLPEYMLPSAFVWLEAMPLTPNGKVDRKALPAPDAERPELGSAYVAPRNPTEETLAAILGQILNLEKVGVEDNFFELGGHSLLATQFISRLRESFRVEVPLREIFERPTAAELAETIARLKAEQKEAEKSELLSKLDALSDEEVEAMLGDFSDDDLEAAYR